MGLYSKYLLPRIIDLAMRNREIARLRADWIPRARGEVIEIGLGSGLNLPFYRPEVRQVLGVDPSRELEHMAKRRARAAPFPVKFLAQSADEPLPLIEETADTVVITWSLCSIPNPSRALSEMRRVLRSDGRLIFIEHGLSPDGTVSLWQNRLTPWWKHLSGGCHLNRKVDEMIRTAGFQIEELRTSYVKGPRPMTYTYEGLARKE
jgi:ubiquinone/menaquinone biosynthesis C-methylase UbiE